jgi:hypothetical protein
MVVMVVTEETLEQVVEVVELELPLLKQVVEEQEEEVMYLL